MKEFAMYTNGELMQAIFSQYLPGFAPHCWQIETCTVRHVWQKTFRKHRGNSFLTALYELQMEKRTTRQKMRQWLYAKAFLNNGSQREFHQHLNEQHYAPGIGVALAHIPELDMVVWNFPNDPGLPNLAEVTDATRVKNHLPYAQLQTSRAEDVTVTMLNYRPELRWVARYDWRDATTAKNFSVVGKTFADEQGAEIFARMQNLWRIGNNNNAAFKTPRPLAYDSSLHTIWQENVAGQPLTNILDAQNYPSLLDQIARGLATLHQSDLVGAHGITAGDHLSESAKKVAKLTTAFPALTTELHVLLQTLQHTKPASINDSVLHGDFHINQLKRSDDRIALFDFDEFAYGDPLQDVANFMADLATQNFAPDLFVAVQKDWLMAYQKYTEPICKRRLAWHLVVQFLTRAYRGLWQQKPELQSRVQFFLELAKPHLLALRQ